MKRTTLHVCLAAAVTLATVSCTGSPPPPTSPSAVLAPGVQGANPDGSTLKATAPAAQSPSGGGTVDTRRPTFTIGNATGVNTGAPIPGVVYRVQLFNEDGSMAAERLVVQAGGSETSIEADGDLEYAKNYTWWARAELSGAFGFAFGPWSGRAAFRTLDPPVAGTGGTGAPRTISVEEAVAIIQRIYADMGFNIGSRSTRDQRNRYLEAAVAALHYGHSRFNPAGPDSQWCIKNGGPGRPQADDVIVRCDTGEAWDLVLSIGADHYRWHPDYIGRLGPPQQIYPPSAAALGILTP